MSTLKVDTITTISGTGNINLSRPIAGDGSNLTGVAPTKATIEALGIDVPAANLTGTVADARFPATLPAASGANLTSLPAANLTGSIADARISESAVTQHVTATDLTSIHQAIATLGLHTAVSDNKAAFNLPNAFIDTFEDDTGITTETDVDRNSNGEYISTSSESIGSASDITASTTTGSVNGYGSANGLGGGAPHWYLDDDLAQSKSATPSNAWVIDLNNNYSLSGQILSWTSFGTDNRANSHYWIYKDISGTWQYLNGTGSGSASGTSSSSSNMTSANSNEVNYITVSSDDNYAAQEIGIIPQTFHANGNHYSAISAVSIMGKPYSITTNATGTLVSDTQTAPAATTEVSGVILYKDNAGTATLGTQLKIYFTANNGTNWTEAASYGTAQTFSGTTKQVKLGKTTVTSGTQVAMKAVWASQASGSMETQLHGWAVNY